LPGSYQIAAGVRHRAALIGRVGSALEMSQNSAPDPDPAGEPADGAVQGSARTPERRGRDSIRTQSEILLAAGELFARRGYAHVTLKDIAELVGVTPALIVYYFGSKRHLFGQVAQMPATTALREHSLDASEVARDLLTFWREDDSNLAALALVRSLDLDGGELFMQAMAERIFGPWSAALSGGDDAEIRARLLGGFLMGYGLFSTNALVETDSGALAPADDARVLVYLERIIEAFLTPIAEDDPLAHG
jgi:AcrR family transcriptional regulator